MGRKQKKSKDPRQAHVSVQVPRTFDLAERQRIAAGLQNMIGEFVAGLLANGVPLTMAVSIRKQGLLDKKNEIVVLSAYWEEADLDVPIFQDVALSNRCLKCGEVVRGDHKCSIPLQSPSQSEKEGLSDEIKSSPSPVSEETEPVSTD